MRVFDWDTYRPQWKKAVAVAREVQPSLSPRVDMAKIQAQIDQLTRGRKAPSTVKSYQSTVTQCAAFARSHHWSDDVSDNHAHQEALFNKQPCDAVVTVITTFLIVKCSEPSLDNPEFQGRGISTAELIRAALIYHFEMWVLRPAVHKSFRDARREPRH